MKIADGKNIGLSVHARQILGLLRLTPFDVSTEDGRSRERYRRIALSGISGLVARFIISLVGLISVSLTINYLGKELFGLWMVVSSLVVWMQLADFGIINGLTNALAEAHGKNDKLAAQTYISTALALTSVVSIVCFLPIVLLATWIPWDILLKLSDPSLTHLAGVSFLVIGVVFIVGLPISVVNRIFFAYQFGHIVNIIQIISSVLSLAGLLIAIYLKLDMPWFVLMVSSGPILGNLFSWLILYRLFPWCRFGWHLISRTALRRIARSCVPLFVFQIGALLVNEIVNVIIARVGTLNMVADYNILLRVYMVIFAIGASLSAPFYSAMREAYEKTEESWVRKSVYRVMVIRIVAVSVPGIALLFVGDWVIKIWINQPFSDNFDLFGWFALLTALILASSSATLEEILVSLDDIWSRIKIVFLSAVIVCGGLYYLIPKAGLAGIYLTISVATIYPVYWSYKRLNKNILWNPN